MHSSTSSSKLIAGAVGICLALALAYTALIHVVVPGGGESQSQHQENVIRLQEYVYAPRKFRCVIVGSSMAARIPARALPADYYNLAMSGGGPLTGLDIIEQSGKIPDCILVEANATVLRGADAKLVSGARSAWGGLARRNLKMLRDAYQPVTLISSALKRARARETDLPLPPNFDELLSYQIRSESELPKTTELDASIQALAERIDQLSAAGARILLFDVPRHPKLESSLQNQFVRERLAKAFSSTKYRWLSFPAHDDYQSSDGVHLVDSSARRFARDLLEAAERALR